MRRMISFLVVVILLFLIGGCRNSADNYEMPVNFYYLHEENFEASKPNVFASEIRETEHYHANILELLNDYFQGPVGNNLISPFPPGLVAEKIDRKNGHLSITVSDDFALLSDFNRTIACTCIFRTLTEFTQCQSIEILVNSTSNDATSPIYISNDNLILFDDMIPTD